MLLITDNYCTICDKDTAAVFDGACAPCWDAHGDDLAAQGNTKQALWAYRNAHRARRIDEDTEVLATVTEDRF